MSSFSQPSFWLEVSKEYVITNFDRLLIYLRDYHYSPNESPTSDFNKTFKCLQELTFEILDQNDESNLGKYRAFDRIDDRKVVRIVAAYLLTCEKKGFTSHERLSDLIDRLLLINEGVKGDVLEDFRAMLLACARHQRVEKYGFDWHHLIHAEGFRIDQFCLWLCDTSWQQVSDLSHIVEQNGLALFDQNRLHLTTINFGAYRRQKLEEQISLGQDIILELPKGENVPLKEPADYQLLNSTLEAAQSIMRPTVEPKMKEYDLGNKDEEVRVRVTNKVATYIYAETIDPDYKKVSGKIHIDACICGINRNDLADFIQVGQVIYVHLQPNYDGFVFSLQKSLEHTYEDFADEYLKTPIAAKFECTYGSDYQGNPLGHRWMTALGFQVNVKGQLDEYREIANDGELVNVEIVEVARDSKKRLVLNGEISMDQNIDDRLHKIADFKRHAQETLFNQFLEDAGQEVVEQVKLAEPEKLPITWLRPFAR
ncbi:MAG: hypothetical protein HUK20_14350, partial [Fibrobacter sp.]|nr:hypothetical protein [Fibrobacter sp.]